MKHIGFQVKLTLVFILLVCVALGVTTYFIYQKALVQQKEELRAKILSLAKLSSMLIDADKHSLIKPLPESEDTLPYKEIRDALKKIRDIDPIINSVYTLVKTDQENIWAFVVDSADKKRKAIAHCGERYDVSNFPQMQIAFDTPSVDKELSSDKWGVWLSGYAPIYNKTGSAVAIVGLDVSAKSIQEMQMLLAKRFLTVLFWGVVFSLFMGWFIAQGITQPLRSLILGVREVGKGNFKQKVNVKSKDEIEELAGAFNRMTDGLLQAQAKLQQHYLDTIKSLALAIEAKDQYTRGHSERVTHFSVNIAKSLGLPDRDIKMIEDICVLHDIGKIGIPEKILSKPSSLTEEEWKVIKRHPEIGEDILKPLEFIKDSLSIVRDHHERPDGLGYPHGLKAKEIPRLAAIVSVADAYDAMTSDRPYRKALAKEKAVAVLKENRNTQFNSHIVDVFVDYLGKHGD